MINKIYSIVTYKDDRDVLTTIKAFDKYQSVIFEFSSENGIGSDKEALRIYNLTRRKNSRFTLYANLIGKGTCIYKLK